MTTCSAPLDSRRLQSALLLLLGPLFIGVSFVLMLRRVEPVTTLFYLCAWYGIIWTLDRLIHWREGRSLIARCGPAFWLILFWSAVGWYAFELINFRLQNWYYIFVLDHLVLQTLNAVFSFATVFPGLLWLEYYLGLRGVAADWQGRRWSLTPRRLTILQIAGLIGLALVLLWPRFFFPLTWLAFILLLAPVEYRRLPDSLLHQLARGDYAPLTRQLLAGFIAGGLWEFFNYWAQVKWIYTVPFFEELKLFEMPLAGFLGFPPFAVECALVYRLLVWYRLAPPLGAHRDQRARADQGLECVRLRPFGRGFRPDSQSLHPLERRLGEAALGQGGQSGSGCPRFFAGRRHRLSDRFGSWRVGGSLAANGRSIGPRTHSSHPQPHRIVLAPRHWRGIRQSAGQSRHSFAGGFGCLICRASRGSTHRASRECSTTHPSANSPVAPTNSRTLTLPESGDPVAGELPLHTDRVGRILT